MPFIVPAILAHCIEAVAALGATVTVSPLGHAFAAITAPGEFPGSITVLVNATAEDTLATHTIVVADTDGNVVLDATHTGTVKDLRTNLDGAVAAIYA